jgi:hypothetical protein
MKWSVECVLSSGKGSDIPIFQNDVIKYGFTYESGSSDLNPNKIKFSSDSAAAVFVSSFGNLWVMHCFV